ncbi:MAG: nucleotide pyrophosphohydrolase [Candidatus Nanoarchaeia archaeon]|nr:nucleotide pyrophosphohydrolase [Candidatus Nanoarchaeia archaeon]
MALEELQREVDKWTAQFTPQYWQAHEILARLMEETGELAREVNHLYGPKKKKDSEDKRDLGDEMADVIFTLMCLANSKNINLDDAWKKMMEKCCKRDSERYKKREDLV